MCASLFQFVALGKPEDAANASVNCAVLYDLNGREAADAEIFLDALPDLSQYIFCSSAGVYKKSDELPHREIDEGDPKSRHKVLSTF